MWSRGLRIFNQLKYKCKAATINDLKILSIKVSWVERLRHTEGNEEVPPEVLEGEETLAAVFPLEDTSVDKFTPGSIYTMRWGYFLHESYADWVDKFNQDTEGTKDEMDEPFYKRPKSVRTSVIMLAVMYLFM